MKKAVFFFPLLLTLALGQVTVPERKHEGNAIISHRDPEVRIEVPTTAVYVGAERWVLYGVADCELHGFVEADAKKNVARLYWIQFEGYIPEKPDAKYAYDSPRHIQLGGMDFIVDTWARSRSAGARQGSDREHIEKIIATQGLKMPAGMAYVRLVHLLDDRKRRELMIIYGEALLPGTPATDLDEQGKDRQTKWPTNRTDPS